MKTRTIILFATICFSFGFCNCSNAQNSNVKKVSPNDMSINGQTYVYDSVLYK